MGGIIGSITDAVGLTDHKGEKKAAEAAERAGERANELSSESIAFAKEQVAFQRDQYADWKNIYGDVQANLGDYYKNLTPDKLVALGLENQQREFQQIEDSLQRDFVQRGIGDSGLERSLESNIKVQNATARAKIRSSGEELANAEKLKFLGIGLGQGQGLLANIGNAASNTTNAFSTGVNSSTTISGNFLNASTQRAIQNQQATNDLFGTAAGFIPT